MAKYWLIKSAFSRLMKHRKETAKFSFCFTVGFCRFFLRFLFNRSLRDSELNLNTNLPEIFLAFPAKTVCWVFYWFCWWFIRLLLRDNWNARIRVLKTGFIGLHIKNVVCPTSIFPKSLNQKLIRSVEVQVKNWIWYSEFNRFMEIFKLLRSW